MVQSYKPIFRSHCTLFLFFSDQSFIQLILLFLFPVYIVFQISIFIGDAYLRIKRTWGNSPFSLLILFDMNEM